MIYIGRATILYRIESRNEILAKQKFNGDIQQKYYGVLDKTVEIEPEFREEKNEPPAGEEGHI